MLPWRPVVRQAYSSSTAIALRVPVRMSHTRAYAARRVSWPLWLGIAGASVAAAMAVPALPLYLEAPMDRSVKEPKSSMDVPVYMQTAGTNVNHTSSILRLVGFGVRTVTFLGFHVYVAGLYVAEDALEASRKPLASGDVDLEKQLQDWLEAGVPCAIRIMPVRSTDFAHLRDGLVRAINVRAKHARALPDTYDMSDEVEKSLSRNVHDLKSLFPRTKVHRGHALDLVVQKTQAHTYGLSLQYNGTELGFVESERVSERVSRRPFTLPVSLLLAYVGMHPDISEALRTSIRHGLTHELP